MIIGRADARRLGIPWPDDLPTGRAGHMRGVMNRVESRYACRLELFRLAGAIAGWAFEPDLLELGPGVTYRPDFRVELPDRSVEYHETKGAWARRDASAAGIVKLKWASQLYPNRRFFLCRLRGQSWVIRQIGGPHVPSS